MGRQRLLDLIAGVVGGDAAVLAGFGHFPEEIRAADRGLHGALEQSDTLGFVLRDIAAGCQAIAGLAGRLQQLRDALTKRVAGHARMQAEREYEKAREPGGGPVRQMPDHARHA